MKGQGTEIWKKEEYSYEGAHGFIPVMVSYMHEDDKIHPAMIVVPGGGYRQVSRTEAHLVAMDFYEADYNVFVLVYTVNPLDEVPLGMQPLQDISRAIRMIRGKAEEYRITPEKIAVCGFSAGGHLCASLSVHWKDIKDHMSLEKHVTADTPPCFLWQTATDESVPVENSYLFAKACKEAGVPYAHHVFSDGVHGMSVATEDWLEERGREPYTMEQIRLLGEAILRGETRFEKKTGEELLAKYGISRPAPEKWSRDEKEHLRKVLKEVGAWRMLAKCWLAAVWDV